MLAATSRYCCLDFSYRQRACLVSKRNLDKSTLYACPMTLHVAPGLIMTLNMV